MIFNHTLVKFIKKTFNISWRLAARDVKSRYVNSALGLGWVILNPAFFVLIISMAFSLVFHNTAYNVPYFLFVLVGYIHWLFFAHSINKIIASLINHRSLIINIYYPIIATPLSMLLSKFLDFLVLLTLTLFLIFLILGSSFIKYLPTYLWILIIQVLFQFGLGLILTVANIYLKDVQYIFNMGLQLLFYITPVVYDTSMVPDFFQTLIRLNPLAWFIDSYRDILFLGRFELMSLMFLSFIAILTLTLGLIVFNKNKRKIAEFI